MMGRLWPRQRLFKPTPHIVKTPGVRGGKAQVVEEDGVVPLEAPKEEN